MAAIECWCTHYDYEHLDGDEYCWGARGYCSCVQFREFTDKDRERLEKPTKAWIEELNEITQENIRRKKQRLIELRNRWSR